MEDEVWYFTFGIDSHHKNDIVVIRGDIHSTREIMNRRFGSHWAFQYDADEGLRILKKYDLNLIVVN